MDPLSVLGAAVGVTSLIIQITDECIKGYKFYNEAANLPETYNYLRVRSNLEQQRFVNFVLEAGILYTNGVLCNTLQINRSLLLAVLAEIKTLLEQYAAKNGKYEDVIAQHPVDWADRNEPESDLIDLLCLPTKNELQTKENTLGTQRVASAEHIRNFGKKILQKGRSLRTIVTEPKRLIWATVDKDSFEQLISKLGHLNSFLISLLDSSQARRLHDVMNTTYLEILQVRNDLGSLKTLVEALAASAETQQASVQEQGSSMYDPLSQAVAQEKAVQAETRAYLKELAEIKIRFTMLSQPDSRLLIATGASGSSPLLPLEKFAFKEDVLEHDPPQLRMSTTYGGSSVWVEWKEISAEFSSPTQIDLVESRIVLLTNLLRLVKPEGFRAPSCLGYIKILDGGRATRFGTVFRNPSTKSTHIKIITLRDLLEEMARPSLSARISLCAVLARCIHSFHTVNWLHKTLCPYNIIYYSDTPDLGAPYLSGFELSRPSVIDEMSEKPRFDLFKDIYRHPNAQSSRTDGRYRRSYDIYSLGIVLIEIALWMPIEDVVGIEDLSNAKLSAIQEIQGCLLGEAVQSIHPEPGVECLPQIACACGDGVRKVVDFCLRADRIEGPEYPGESETSIALRLQRVIEQDVVKKLEHIAGVL